MTAQARGGRGGAPGMTAQAGSRGSAKAGAPSSTHGSAPPFVATGGTSASGGGTTRSAGGSTDEVAEDTGGSPGSGGEAPSAGSPSTAGEANGGAAEGGAGTGPSVDQAAVEAETIDRWNAIADNRTGDTYHFHWTHDMFPHPTFAAMGEAEGYREFAFVLDDFLTANFDFLAERRQFLTPYYYVTASPSDVDLEATWDELATDFSTLSYGDTPEAVKGELAGYATAMKRYE